MYIYIYIQVYNNLKAWFKIVFVNKTINRITLIILLTREEVYKFLPLPISIGIRIL